MGLFDDITGFLSEAQSLKKEVVQLGSDVAKELVADASGMKETVSDTANSVKSVAQDIQSTVKDSVSLQDDTQTPLQQDESQTSA